MVYFPRETISFSACTVLSSAGFGSLFCYSSLSRLPSFLPSRVLMLLPAPLDPISAPSCSEDGATLLTRNGFSTFGGLSLHFF